MMKRISLILLLFSLVLNSSCGQSISDNEARRDDFDSYQKLERITRTYEEDIFFGRPQTIDLIDDWFAVFDSYDTQLVTWVSKDLKKTKRGLSKGLGPGEFTSGLTFYLSGDKNQVTIFENGKDVLRTYRTKDMINDNLQQPLSKTSLKTRGIRAMPFGDGYLFAKAESDGKLFSAVNTITNEERRFGDYKREGISDFNASDKYLYMRIQNIVTANHTRQIVVGAGRSSDYLAFYQVNNGSIDLLNQYQTYEADFTVGEFENGAYARPNDKTKTAYIALHAGEKYLYALYIGCLTNELSKNRDSYLQVFDWDGNFIKGFKLDAPVYDITVDEDTNLAYTIFTGPQSHIRVYQLDGLN